MIVVGDADVIANHVSKKGAVFALGYDRYTGQNYGNRNFILNCMDYLCGNKEILGLRGKEFRLRMLDPAKVENKSAIQWINLLLPVLLVIFFGLFFTIFRKRRFAK
jgi:ABC-2 type transport system permease protein